MAIECHFVSGSIPTLKMTSEREFYNDNDINGMLKFIFKGMNGHFRVKFPRSKDVVPISYYWLIVLTSVCV